MAPPCTMAGCPTAARHEGLSTHATLSRRLDGSRACCLWLSAKCALSFAYRFTCAGAKVPYAEHVLLGQIGALIDANGVSDESVAVQGCWGDMV
jgi:hypothetical protein